MKNNYFNRTLALLLSLLLLGFSAVSPKSASAADMGAIPALPENTDNYAQGEVIVTCAVPRRTALAREGSVSFDEDINVEASWNFGDADTASLKKEAASYRDKTLYVSHISSDTYSTEDLIEKLSDQPYVISVEPNRYRRKMSVSEDAFSGQQWYLDGSGDFQTKSPGIRYTKNTKSAGNTPVVAVVDTGIDYTHEDLKDHMWQNTYPGLQGTYGYDFGDNDSNPMDEDEDGHGTHCAGVIGAVSDNQIGIAGVAGDVKLMALKVFNSKGEIDDSAIIGAFNYIYQARELGVNITAVNCSWGGGRSSSAMKTLIDKIGQQGALFLFAAGNSATNQDNVITMRKECPYDISSKYIVTVGAAEKDDSAASFSDYGKNSVDVFVPGTQIFSSVNQPVFLPGAYSEEKRNSLTSFYSAGEQNSLAMFTPKDLGLSYSRVTYGSFEHSSEDFFGDNSGSFYVPFSTSSWLLNTTFTAYLDVSALSLDPLATYYAACDYSPEEESPSAAREWLHVSRKIKSSDFVTMKGKQYLRLFSISGNLYSYSGFFIDQVAISSADPDTSSFGKYNYMDGTSMSAPIVSGAVAALSAMYPSDSAYQRRERLLSCVRKISALADKCKTGGMIDMSLFASSSAPQVSATPDATETPSASPSVSPSAPTATPAPAKVYVTKVTINKKSAKLRYKKKLKLKASVSPSNASNKKVKWSVSKTKYAKVTQQGVVKAKKKGIGHTVKVYAAAKDGSKKKASCKVKIKS